MWFRVRLACGRRRTKSWSFTESESRFETASVSYRSSERRWRKREAIAMSNDQKKIVSASAAEPLGVEFERLLQPTRYFQHPRDVVRDATLTPPKSGPSCRHGHLTPVPSNRCLRCGRS